MSPMKSGWMILTATSCPVLDHLGGVHRAHAAAPELLHEAEAA